MIKNFVIDTIKTVTAVTNTGKSMEASGNEIENALISKTSMFLRVFSIHTVRVRLGKQTVSQLIMMLTVKIWCFIKAVIFLSSFLIPTLLRENTQK